MKTTITKCELERSFEIKLSASETEIYKHFSSDEVLRESQYHLAVGLSEMIMEKIRPVINKLFTELTTEQPQDK